MKTTISITCFENNNTCNISPPNIALFTKDSQDKAGLILANEYQDGICSSSIIFVKKTSDNSSDNSSEYKNLRMKIKDSKGIINTDQELFDKTFHLGEVNAGETKNYSLEITRNSINESILPSYLDFDAVFTIKCDGKEMTVKSIEEDSGKVKGVVKKEIVRAKEIESTVNSEKSVGLDQNRDEIESYSYFPWIYYLAGLVMFLSLLLLILFFYKKRKEKEKESSINEIIM